MRIGYVLENFSPLSESFIRREILALCRADCQVFVYVGREHYGPRVPEPRHANLFTREGPISNVNLLTKAAFADGIEHLHGSLMSSAHRATFAAARVAQVPFTLMAYSGHDIFRKVQPKLYAAAANHPLCISIVVEDVFMREWMIEHYGAAADKIRIIPNSLDVDLYRLAENRIQGERITILSIARFVEKKGLIYLIEAFDRLSKGLSNIELWLVGYGPEGDRLTAAAAGNDRIKFLGPLSEAETRRLYPQADIFCLPCIRLEDGDADGVPATLLEAMSFELPVVSTPLLTLPEYVRDGVEGLLVSERNVDAIAGALKSLCLNAELRRRMGQAGRASVDGAI